MNNEFDNDSIKLDAETIEDEFEEITSDEVDRVVDALESLMETVSSENIRTYLEEASENIYQLIYDETAESEQEEECDPEDLELLDDVVIDEAA